MFETHGIALLALTAVLLAWVWVQSAWRRTFPGAFDDPDVLADRIGCQSCERAPECEHAPAGRGPARKESS